MLFLNRKRKEQIGKERTNFIKLQWNFVVYLYGDIVIYWGREINYKSIIAFKYYIYSQEKQLKLNETVSLGILQWMGWMSVA